MGFEEELRGDPVSNWDSRNLKVAATGNVESRWDSEKELRGSVAVL